MWGGVWEGENKLKRLLSQTVILPQRHFPKWRDLAKWIGTKLSSLIPLILTANSLKKKVAQVNKSVMHLGSMGRGATEAL